MFSAHQGTVLVAVRPVLYVTTAYYNARFTQALFTRPSPHCRWNSPTIILAPDDSPGKDALCRVAEIINAGGPDNSLVCFVASAVEVLLEVSTIVRDYERIREH